MANKTANIDFDENNLAFLEQVEDADMMSHKVDDANLAYALGIDIDNLENVNEKGIANSRDSNLPMQNMAVDVPEDITQNIKIKKELSSLVLSMNDAIIKVFELSDRPFIVIRDDKIVYINKTALAILELRSKEGVIGSSFWDYVDPQDWNVLAENIGAMLTDNKAVDVRLKTDKGRIYKINLQAMYLDDEQHFSFVLLGDRKIKYNPNAGLYDAVTNLPNFYLFEDRVQIAINNEKYKDIRQRKNMMAVLGVSIDNLEELKDVNMVDFVLKKLSSKLVFRLKKSYTVARGLKYQFWLLINDFNNEHDLEVEIEKIKAIFDEPVSGNYMDYNIVTSFGYSVYPINAKTSNKLIESAIEAIKTAIILKQN